MRIEAYIKVIRRYLALANIVYPYYRISWLVSIVLFFGVFAIPSLAQNTESSLNSSTVVDTEGYAVIQTEASNYRAGRLITIEEFNKMAKDSSTIVLDTRSKTAYDSVHVEGAINLNFADFTDKKLAAAIPNKNTRILIYCNNNFSSTLESLGDKRPPLALNLPTFINLYGYGYTNIYELTDRLDQNDPRLSLEGDDIN